MTEHKCRDCRFLTGEKHAKGIECMNPVNQERWNKQRGSWMGEFRQVGRYKPPSGTACKRFEPKDEYDRVTYCDVIEDCNDCPRYGDDCDGNGEDDERD